MVAECCRAAARLADQFGEAAIRRQIKHVTQRQRKIQAIDEFTPEVMSSRGTTLG